MKYANNKTGILVVNKPSGPTSRDIVNKVQRLLNTKCGHTGTLDPLATGVLVITWGTATKLSEVLTSQTKEYQAEVILGLETDTLDTEGTILKKETKIISKEDITKALKYFEKTYNQEVPKYSAVKVNGKKLYEYARKGEDVELPKKEITVFKNKLLSYEIKDNKTIFTFYTKVSKGTYIRSLIRDIAFYLNTYGTMSALTRISQGKFKLDEAFNIEDIEKGYCQIMTIKDALDIEVKEVNDEEKFKILNGVPLDGNNEKILFVDKEGKELAIYQKENGKLRMWKMLYENSRESK